MNTRETAENFGVSAPVIYQGKKPQKAPTQTVSFWNIVG